MKNRNIKKLMTFWRHIINNGGFTRKVEKPENNLHDKFEQIVKEKNITKIKQDCKGASVAVSKKKEKSWRAMITYMLYVHGA